MLLVGAGKRMMGRDTAKAVIDAKVTGNAGLPLPDQSRREGPNRPAWEADSL
jgi:hypothetical protein